MLVAIGSDHGGFKLKEDLKKFLDEENYAYQDLGVFSEAKADYPDTALKVAREVAGGKFERGILICGTGIGMCVAANKVNGIRAALCHDVFSAKLARNHNNANILTMGERVVGCGLARMIAKTWLEASFDGERHAARVDKITGIEKLQ